MKLVFESEQNLDSAFLKNVLSNITFFKTKEMWILSNG